MLSPLELKKIKVELLRVIAVRGDFELRIEERKDEISRIEEQIVIQDAKIAELQAKIDAETSK